MPTLSQKSGLTSADLRLGTKINQWTIIGPAPPASSGGPKLYCRCSCDVIKSIYSKHLLSGASRSCHKCSQVRTASALFKGHEGLYGKTWYRIKTDAKSRSLHLDITIEQAWDKFVAQDGWCALSGLPIELEDRSGSKRTASLDRIRSEEGYTLDNIQWVHKDVNMMKRNFPETRFIELCRAVATHHARCGRKKSLG